MLLLLLLVMVSNVLARLHSLLIETQSDINIEIKSHCEDSYYTNQFMVHGNIPYYSLFSVFLYFPILTFLDSHGYLVRLWEIIKVL
jgi:hypothetical protein